MTTESFHRQFITDNFVNACIDYHYLVNRHFPEKGVLKLAGDRYKLNGDQRTVLYRGISSDAKSKIRNSLLVEDIKERNIAIDGYNVLFTILNYRNGKPVFISTDHILRDAGALHGRVHSEKIFAECVELLVGYLQEFPPAGVMVYLDSPVSHSEKHASLIREIMAEKKIQGDCFVIRSADYGLKQSNGSTLATSDTAVIESAMQNVIDLPRAVLTRYYKTSFISIPEILFAYQA